MGDIQPLTTRRTFQLFLGAVALAYAHQSLDSGAGSGRHFLDIDPGFASSAARPEDLIETHGDHYNSTHDHELMIEPGTLDPLIKELVYIAISTANSCSYCIHSHTAAARAKGLSDAQYAEFLAVVSTAATTNALANALQIPIDPEFLAG